MTITALPTPPTRSDPSTFAARGDAFMTALPTFVTEANALAADVTSKQATASTAATNASASQSAASTSATNAATSATNASNSASAASTSQSAAASSAGAAAASATTATTQATAAAASATTATTKASEASASAAAASAIVLGVSTTLPAMRPTLLLDFANARTIDPRITFTRASTATRTNALGLLETVASGVPRIDYDPVTLACKGLLIEEARTNLLTYSEQFDNAVWSKTRSSITANVATAPDGTVTADKLIEDSTAGNTHTISQAYTDPSGTTITLSAFLKAGERAHIWFQISDNATGAAGCVFNLSSGTFTTPTNGGPFSATSATITAVGNGWYRCTMTTTRTGSGAAWPYFVVHNGTTGSYTGDGTSGIYIWGAQLEAGVFATSYIPTVASQVTRAADVASMTGANFSGWYRQDEGSFVVTSDQYSTGGAAVQYVAFEAGDGTNNNLVQVGTQYGTTSFQYLINTSSVGQVTITSAATTAATTRSVCYKLNDCAQSINGATVSTDTSATMPAVSILGIGNRSNNIGQINGHISRLAYYPKRLSNAELQSLTS